MNKEVNLHNLSDFKLKLKTKIFKNIRKTLNQLDLDGIIFFVSFIENNKFNLLKSKDNNLLYYLDTKNKSKESTINKDKIEDLLSLLIHNKNPKSKISRNQKNCS